MSKRYIGKNVLKGFEQVEGPANTPKAADVLHRILSYEAEQNQNALDGQYMGLQFNRQSAELICDLWKQGYWLAKDELATRGIKSRTKWFLWAVDVLPGNRLRLQIKLY